MKKKNISALVLGGLLIMSAAPLVMGQIHDREGVPDLRLGLASEKEVAASRFSGLSEFNISLGSAVMPEPSPVLSGTRFSIPAGIKSSAGLARIPVKPASGSLGTAPSWRQRPTSPSMAGGPATPDLEFRESSTAGPITDEWSSTLTLTTGYFEDASPQTGIEPSALRTATRRGRWAFYGEFSKGPVTSKRVIPVPTQNLEKKEVMAKVLANTGGNPGPGYLPAPTITEGTSGLTADKFHLEAVYDFLPTVKGKVSYKRSVIDTIDRQEKIQVEGVVETGRDTAIKAGYKNESLPEVNQKSSKDSQVWTEFILKF